MANSIKLDWRNQEIFYVPGADVEFIKEDKTESVVFENEQFENLVDDYRRSIGEKTFSELEDKILELEVALENAHEIIEEKERLEDVRRERYFSPSY
ncbi:hypothetical protein [Clostridium saudiense]|jgi:hypothetical protein|uniref:hypothetical protein n=1 Tax=Clostridium saudiense TaxID=1414720 RepID=UPI00205F6CDB|nr:hypothetical protein [Clostridium saudiense]MDU7453064.1 hypothetical protein [Clostridium saudiense]MEE0725360.1 hypothetical protein [Clostridium saudiense]DAU87269.1 MAG TPA: hypothetical protein [Caudoviricetes sp.]